MNILRFLDSLFFKHKTKGIIKPYDKIKIIDKTKTIDEIIENEDNIETNYSNNNNSNNNSNNNNNNNNNNNYNSNTHNLEEQTKDNHGDGDDDVEGNGDLLNSSDLYESSKIINIFYTHLHPSNIKHLHNAICIKCLGKGGFGEVKLYQCKERDKKYNSVCNKCFVVKEIKIKKWADEQDKNKQLKVLMNEYTVGTLLHHKYIRETLDIDLVDRKIIFEYCPGIDFFELIEKNKENHSKFQNEYIEYFKKIIDAVEYMHDQGVAHLDLKLENIVINEKHKSIKIIDFGGSCVCKVKKYNTSERNSQNDSNKSVDSNKSKKFDESNVDESNDDESNVDESNDDEIIKISGMRGTEAYMAPEEFRLGKYDPFKVDIWALGIIFYEILYRTLPWQNTMRDNKRFNDHVVFFNNTNQLIPYIFKLYPKLDCYDKEYVLFNNLFIQMLNPKPELRGTIKDIKQTLMTT